MILSPILLDDQTLCLDSTATETFKLCPTKFNYEQVRRRVRSGPKPAADFGGALHAALEERYTKAGNKAVNDPSLIHNVPDAMHRAVETAFRGIDTPLDEWRNLARAHETIDHNGLPQLVDLHQPEPTPSTQRVVRV